MDFPKALEAYLDAVRLSTDDPIYLNGAGTHYYTLAQYDNAIGYFEKALKIFKKAGLHHHKKTVEENLKIIRER